MLATRSRWDLLIQPSGFPPVYSAVPVLALVHDIFPITHPGWFPVWQRTWARATLGFALRRCAGIQASSEATAGELERFLGIDRGRIHVHGLGCDEVFRRMSDVEIESERKRRGLGRFVLCVGSLEPRKNLRVVLDAVRLARRMHPDLELVHVGPRGWLESGLVDTGTSWCRLMGHVTKEELVWFYNAAEVFVFPSLAEGFGLPVLEAMRCGTPTVHSNLSVLREITDGSAPVFEPTDSIELSERILSLLGTGSRENPRVLGAMARSDRFTWRSYADACLDFAMDIVERTGGSR